MVRSVWRILRWFLFLFLIYVGGILLFGTINDFQPEPVLDANCFSDSEVQTLQDSTYSALIWNIGYGGLGDKAEFFYDEGNMFFSNGEMVRSDKVDVKRYIDGAVSTSKNSKIDFLLLQEVDYDSKRSYYINQFEAIQKVKPDMSSCFTPNYNVEYVPIPILEPWKGYGQVLSGLANFSTYQPLESQRIQLPGEFPWPTRIFQLDRCLLTQKYKLKNGKFLYVINLHLSAYDKTGELKAKQMAFLKDYLQGLYEDGNYVLAGGDWNQCPPNFPYDRFAVNGTSGYSQINIDMQYLPEGWQWMYDPTTPTNRKMNDPFDSKKTFTTLIDFYLLSPNLKAHTVKTLHQNFQYSDHQPVYLEFEIKE